MSGPTVAGLPENAFTRSFLPMRIVLFAVTATLAAFAPSAPSAGAAGGSWTSEEIRHALAGNSIVHPDFGCVFFRPDGGTEIRFQESLATGFWEVRDDLYFSSGRCGEVGCRLTGVYPELKFRRVDGEYEQDAIVILGNHCKRDAAVS